MEHRAPKKKEGGPGVPEALPRTIQRLGRELGVDRIDRLWVFPPLIRGRREWGLVSVSCFAEGEARDLLTATYTAERTGKGLTVETELSEEGLAPPDRLPRVMSGVPRRSPLGLGDARVVEIAGTEDAFRALLGEWDADLFEPEPAPEHESEAGAEATAEASNG